MQRDKLPEHYSREHYNRNGKAKKAYKTIRAALNEIKYRKLDGYNVYLCNICSFYHIGKQK